MTTFADALSRRIGDDPGRPLVTYYDLDSGERVELSVTTYANWVAKAASLLADEHGLERGQRLRLDLPTHWLGPVFLGAAWTVGLRLTDADDPDALDAVVCGPEGLRHWSAFADRLLVLGCSLLPLGVRFAEALPQGVHDVGVEVWGQPDAFTAWDPPGPDDVAADWSGIEVTQAQLWNRAAAGASPSSGDRLLSTANPASPSGFPAFTEPLVAGGSLVLVSGGAADEPAGEAVARIHDAERCTGRFSPPGRTP